MQSAVSRINAETTIRGVYTVGNSLNLSLSFLTLVSLTVVLHAGGRLRNRLNSKIRRELEEIVDKRWNAPNAEKLDSKTEPQ